MKCEQRPEGNAMSARSDTSPGFAETLLAVLLPRDSWHAWEIRGSGGERFATLVTLHDITPQTRAAEELHQRSEELAAALERSDRVFEAMSEGVLLVDDDRRVLSGNPAASQILTGDQVPVEGRLLADLLPGLAHNELATKADAAEAPLITQVTLTDGRMLTVEVIPLLTTRSTGATTLFVIRDETERIAAERMQRDFVSNAAHELQTPLTGLGLLASTIPRALQNDPERASEFIERLGGEIHRLVLITNELMALSRLDAREGGHAPSNIDLSLIVSREVRDARELIATRRQTVSIDVPSSLKAVADETDLSALVGNLIDNAVRHTQVRGHIDVRLAEETDADGSRWAVFCVTDNGPGISAADIERIFERFYRVDRSRSSRTGGAGLGLSIVKTALQRAGGTIDVASEPGQGSTFTVRLPLSPAV